MSSPPASSLPSVFRKFTKATDRLKRILADTRRALDEITVANLFPGEDIIESLLKAELAASLQNALDCAPGVVVFGRDCHAKALLLNLLLWEELLPYHSCAWKWVKIAYGPTRRRRLIVANEYEVVDDVVGEPPTWTALPEEDLVRGPGDVLPEQSALVDVELSNLLLKDSVQILVVPDCELEAYAGCLAKRLDCIFPVILYVILGDQLSQDDVLEVRKLKEVYPNFPVLFVSVTPAARRSCDDTADLTESEQHLLEATASRLSAQTGDLSRLREHLEKLGFLNRPEECAGVEAFCRECDVDSRLAAAPAVGEELVAFAANCFRSHLSNVSALLSEVHNNCVRKLILSAFDMTREMQITPRRIAYAQARETELYTALMKIVGEKQDEIIKIIQATLVEMKADIANVIEDEFFDCGKQTAKMVTNEIQQIVLRKLSFSIANQVMQSVGCLQESFIGTLQRCLESLEKNCNDPAGSTATGTGGGNANVMASDAFRQILTAAYNVDLKTFSSLSVVQTFFERLRKLVHGLQMPWSNATTKPRFDVEWRRQVAIEVTESLSSQKLFRTISTQFQERVRSAHEAFQASMRTLENHLSGVLEQIEERRITIRKYHAPRFARLALESTSAYDTVMWGVPQTLHEIGRGQYGVVFACKPWAGIEPCAVKSVVPPDYRHWNDLAMEFYYTRTIPDHPRVVRLRGSVIDHSYCGGCSPAVLLVMERMARDLYHGLKSRLAWTVRVQIAIDVIEGIRYLHSQGLVHRDIKLKNVLLDADNRAKLTDLGFCVPEAMMSGSIVGTPVHMAPELLSGQYDSSVDVYAFGILFWYICSGDVRLPDVFDQCLNKEQLWLHVRRGMRPECLPCFDEDCWNLMKQCWAAEPASRPLLGDVQPQLEAIMEQARRDSAAAPDSGWDDSLEARDVRRLNDSFNRPEPMYCLF